MYIHCLSIAKIDVKNAAACSIAWEQHLTVTLVITNYELAGVGL